MTVAELERRKEAVMRLQKTLDTEYYAIWKELFLRALNMAPSHPPGGGHPLPMPCEVAA